MDYVLVLLFLCIIFLGVWAHLEARGAERKYNTEVALREALVRESTQLLRSEREEAKLREERLRADLLQGGGGAVATTTEPTGEGGDGGDIVPVASGGDLGGEAVTLVPTSTPTQTFDYPRFQDVTAVRYENTRLGFLMELPQGWYLAYERGGDLAFGSDLYAFDIALDDMKKPDGALWVRVTRPCTSTEATSTVFAFATSTQATIREASSCIPPFLVTLGYRADAPTPHLREQFLLNLGRTFYPMVSPTAPYPPLR